MIMIMAITMFTGSPPGVSMARPTLTFRRRCTGVPHLAVERAGLGHSDLVFASPTNPSRRQTRPARDLSLPYRTDIWRNLRRAFRKGHYGASGEAGAFLPAGTNEWPIFVA